MIAVPWKGATLVDEMTTRPVKATARPGFSFFTPLKTSV
jgi:hypothetical protein